MMAVALIVEILMVLTRGYLAFLLFGLLGIHAMFWPCVLGMWIVMFFVRTFRDKTS